MVKYSTFSMYFNVDKLIKQIHIEKCDKSKYPVKQLSVFLIFQY